MSNNNSIRRCLKQNAGQSLLEVLVGLSIGVIIIGASVFTIAAMLRSTSVSKQNYSASVITQDLLERVRMHFGTSWVNFSAVTSTSAFHYFLNASGTALFSVEGEEGVLDNDVTDGLVGQWKFDEAPTGGLYVTYDGTGNKNTGFLERGALAASVPQRTPTSTCRISNCLSINGGQYSGTLANWVRVPYSSLLDIGGTALSFSVWVRPSGVPPGGQFGGIIRHQGTTYGYRLSHRTDGGIIFQLGNVTQFSVQSVKILPLNQWTHVMAVYEAGVMRLYINGQPDASGTGPASLAQGVEDIYFGVTTDSYSFNGQLDDLRIYNRAVSEDEINRLVKSNAFRRYFYVNNTCRTPDSTSTIVGIPPCGGNVLDPATKAISVVTEWFVGAKWSQYVFTDYLTRWQNNVFWQNDWSGGPGSSAPLPLPDNHFASSTNIDYASGSLRLRNL